MGKCFMAAKRAILKRLYCRGTDSRPTSPVAEVDAVVAPGPSQVLTGILGKLPDATSRDHIDQAATEFMFVNSKAARKRLVKVYSIGILLLLGANYLIVFGYFAQATDGSHSILWKTCCYY